MGNAPEKKQRYTHAKLLWVIVAFKILKGFMLITVAFGAYHMIDHDISDAAERWVGYTRVDPDNRYVQYLLDLVDKLDLISDKTLREFSVGILFYAAIVFTEGVGLALRKRWAEYFTIIVTASFLPLEIYEIAHHVTPTKIVLLAANLFILYYLVGRLRKGK